MSECESISVDIVCDSPLLNSSNNTAILRAHLTFSDGLRVLFLILDLSYGVLSPQIKIIFILKSFKIDHQA